MHDLVTWGLITLFGITVVVGLASLFNRYDKFDLYQNRLYYLEYDIVRLKAELEQKKIWVDRLKTDPTVWEQVAREKMNYLGPNEILVTFVPGR